MSDLYGEKKRQFESVCAPLPEKTKETTMIYMSESLQTMFRPPPLPPLALRIYLSDVAGIKGRGRGSGK